MQSHAMRQLTFLLLFALLVAALQPARPTSAAVRAQTADGYAPGVVIVRLRPGFLVRQFAVQHRLQMSPAGDAMLGNAIYRLEILDQSNPTQKAAELLRDGRVLYAEPDFLVAAPEASQRSSWAVGEAEDPAAEDPAAETSPEDEDAAEATDPADAPTAAQRSSWAVGEEGDPALAYASQWALAATGLPTAHQITRGNGIIVAMLDTGVDPAHPALAGRLLAGYDFIDNDDDPNEATSAAAGQSYGHGTHVAGLVALAAPEALILPLRTLDADGVGTIWGQAQALWYAMEHGADVINLSWSMPQSSRLIDDLLGLAACRPMIMSNCMNSDSPGAVIVAAAGNSGDTTPQYPGSSRIPGLLSVAASTEAGEIAAFSTVGPWVNLAAPGDQVISSIPGGGYAIWSGTSMATPLAAGTVALLRASAPQLSPILAVNRITLSASTTAGSVRRHLDAPATVAGR